MATTRPFFIPGGDFSFDRPFDDNGRTNGDRGSSLVAGALFDGDDDVLFGVAFPGGGEPSGCELVDSGRVGV